jgi:hypothetical protein
MKVGRIAVRFVGACIVVAAVAQGVTSFVVRDSRAAEWQGYRQATAERLAASGQHLIIVEYGPRHRPDFEWVYNAADIDASPVVWARSLGEPDDTRLRDYFAGRSQWRLQVDDDAGPFTLTPLAPAAPATAR